MGWRRRTGLGISALVLAGCFTAGSAGAARITVYDHVELGADSEAASARIDGEGGSATFDVSLYLAAKPHPLSSAPLEFSFQHWDASLLLSGDAVAPVDPNDPWVLTQALSNP